MWARTTVADQGRRVRSGEDPAPPGQRVQPPSGTDTLRVAVATALCAFALAGNARGADEVHWTVTGPTSVTLDWRGTDGTIRYGLGTSYGQTATASTPGPLPFSSAGPFWEAKLTGLQADTIYHYSIASGPDHTFRTAPPPGATGFSVMVEADVGDSTAYSNMPEVQALIAADVPRLVLIPGDLTYGNDHGQAVVDQHFDDVMVWSQDAAYMPAWGNHEWDDQSYDDLRNYKGRFDFANPQTSPGSPAVSCCGEDWYWFDYGAVRFIAYPEPWSGAWSDWNAKVGPLMDAAQSDPGIKYIVTFGHRPAYSSGHHASEATLKGYLDALACGHGKYVLNVNGHSHNYERTYPQRGSGCSTGAPGVVHVTAGTGGAGLEADGTCLWDVPCGGSCPCPPPAYSAFRAMHQGAVRVTFHTNGIREEFLCGPAGGGPNDITCAAGEVVDTGVIGDLVSAGRVPATVSLGKTAGGAITLSWERSCVTSDTDYEIYEGALAPPFDSHSAISCSTGGATTATIAPRSGDAYYLVVPTSGAREGSYGTRSDDTERPPGLNECAPQQVGLCP